MLHKTEQCAPVSFFFQRRHSKLISYKSAAATREISLILWEFCIQPPTTSCQLHAIGRTRSIVRGGGGPVSTAGATMHQFSSLSPSRWELFKADTATHRHLPIRSASTCTLLSLPRLALIVSGRGRLRGALQHLLYLLPFWLRYWGSNCGEVFLRSTHLAACTCDICFSATHYSMLCTFSHSQWLQYWWTYCSSLSMFFFQMGCPRLNTVFQVWLVQNRAELLFFTNWSFCPYRCSPGVHFCSCITLLAQVQVAVPKTLRFFSTCTATKPGLLHPVLVPLMLNLSPLQLAASDPMIKSVKLILNLAVVLQDQPLSCLLIYNWFY